MSTNGKMRSNDPIAARFLFDSKLESLIFPQIELRNLKIKTFPNQSVPILSTRRINTVTIQQIYSEEVSNQHDNCL